MNSVVKIVQQDRPPLGGEKTGEMAKKLSLRLSLSVGDGIPSPPSYRTSDGKVKVGNSL